MAYQNNRVYNKGTKVREATVQSLRSRMLFRRSFVAIANGYRVLSLAKAANQPGNG